MTYIAILCAALSVFAVWLYYRARHNHHCEEATGRLRDALKANAENTVRALLISDRKWLSAQQARDAEHHLFTLDEKRDEQKARPGEIKWRSLADDPPPYESGTEVLVCNVESRSELHRCYGHKFADDVKKWTHWAEMPRCAR